MAVIPSGKVTQSVPVNGVVTLTFTDATTGLGTVSSRILVISDANGNILQTINMGSSLTATYSITQDIYASFVETIVDNTGTYTATVNYVSTAFYIYAYAPAVVSVSSECCDTFGTILRLYDAEDNKNAAVYMAQFGQGVNSQALITQANFLVNSPYYA